MRRRLEGILVLSAFAVGLVMGSCRTDPAEWYPSGSSSIATFYELSDGTTKSAVLSLRVDNTGRSRISGSTVSVEVKTAARSYFRTFVSSTTILPGGSIWFGGSLDYADLSESASLASVWIRSQFYD